MELKKVSKKQPNIYGGFWSGFAIDKRKENGTKK